MGFSTAQARYLLRLISEEEGRQGRSTFGYSDAPLPDDRGKPVAEGGSIGQLQAQLSVHLELAGRMGR